ncbi:hypothetical protein D3C76_961500 [compost metagenome]
MSQALMVGPAQRPLACLTEALRVRLALVNQVTRVLREHGSRVVWTDLGIERPRLVVERAGGPLFLERVGRFRLALREEPTVMECHAHLLGCEVFWRRPR